MQDPTRRTIHLALPILIGQVCVLAGAVIDTVMTGHRTVAGLAAIGIASSIYVTILVGLMGILLAVSPLVAARYGAGKLVDIRPYAVQSAWLSLMLGLPAAFVLRHPGPLFAVLEAPPEVEGIAREYLGYCALGLPGALLFRAFYGVTTAVSRAKAVMLIHLAMVAVRVPLNLALLDGVEGRVAAFGAAGCGVSAAVTSWLGALAGLGVLVLDKRYRAFGLPAWDLPRPKVLAELVRVGAPIGFAQVVEVLSFTSMSFLIARLGAVALGAHQIAANIATTIFMVPFSISMASSIVAAQAVGAKNATAAEQAVDTGLRLVVTCAVALTGLLLLGRHRVGWLYTDSPEVVALLSTVLVWVAAAQVGDGIQVFYAALLRGYAVTAPPVVAALVCRWFLGLGLGFWLAHRGPRLGVQGFWIGCAFGLMLSGVFLRASFDRVRSLRAERRSAPAPRKVRSPFEAKGKYLE